MTKPFIVFEGLDGSGKSTQVAKLSQWLTEKDILNLAVHEPGSTELGDIIRNLLKTYDMPQQTRLLLFNACRNLLLQKLHNYPDHWIICDRYKQSTWACQHYVGGLDADLMRTLDNMHDYNRDPDLVVLLQADKSITPRDELEKVSASQEVQHAFEKMADEKWLIVPRMDIDATFEYITDHISKRFAVFFDN